MSAADDINRLARKFGRSPVDICDKVIRMCETRSRMLDGLSPRDDEEIMEREAFTEVDAEETTGRQGTERNND